MCKIERTDEEIAHLKTWAKEAAFDKMETHYPGMSYEDGVLQTLEWLSGEKEDSPADD
jgi:hypothetical protein